MAQKKKIGRPLTGRQPRGADISFTHQQHAVVVRMAEAEQRTIKAVAVRALEEYCQRHHPKLGG